MEGTREMRHRPKKIRFLKCFNNSASKSSVFKFDPVLLDGVGLDGEVDVEHRAPVVSIHLRQGRATRGGAWGEGE